jgi:predicted Zn finger-like uncharacterized protein
VKFLCDQCKAKYQISDDKVAGKTVRMKCRKCGHMIEVRAAVTETSVAGAAAAAERASELPPAPGAPPKPAAPAKPATLPGRPPLATSLSQAKQAPRPVQKPETGLASAFKSSMQTAKEDEAGLLELSSADEWYAAINGVPVGPVRIAELRRKAAIGAVTEDSLVWQEGMEEWRPVKQVPELAALVREAATTRGPSLGTPDPPNVRGSMIPPAPQAPNASMRPGPQRPAPPRPASVAPPPPAARSNVVPITSRLATAEKLEEAPAPAGSPTSARFSVAPDPFNAAAPAPAAPAAASATPYREPSPSVMQPQVILQQPKAPPNFLGIGAALMMVAFGGVAGYAVFFKPPAPVAPPQVIVQQMPAPQATATTPAGDTASNETAPAPSASTGKVASSAKVASNAGGARDAGAAPDLGGLLKGLGGGPAVGAGGPSQYSGQPLTSDQLQSIVSQHQLAVRRQCVDKGGGSVAATNETVQITIGPNGTVQGAVATGNDPVTGHCLETEIKRWQFPATGTTATVNVPFKFVRQ